jgi:hypothetical protein
VAFDTVNVPRRGLLGNIAGFGIAFVVVISALSFVVGGAVATGGCTYCVYEPFSNSVTTNAVVSANGAGVNTNVNGPTTSGGYMALIEPESQAYYTPLGVNTYELNVSAGFDDFSTHALSGTVNAVFYWNLTWDASITAVNCTPNATYPVSYPYGLVELSLYASIYNVTGAAYIQQLWSTIFVITWTSCTGGSTSYIVSSPEAQKITHSFKAMHGDTYEFESELYGFTEASAPYVSPFSGVGVESLLNAASGYNGQMSAIQVY